MRRTDPLTRFVERMPSIGFGPSLAEAGSMAAADILATEAMGAAEGGLMSRAGAGGPAFDPAKLARIVTNLEGQGVTFILDGDAALATTGAEARYLPSPMGGPGTIVLGSNPSRAAVIEELTHLGQHRAAGFPADWPGAGKVPALEMGTQVRLLRLRTIQWTPAETESFINNWNWWRTRQ